MNNNTRNQKPTKAAENIMPYIIAFVGLIVACVGGAIYFEANVPIYRNQFVSPLLAVLFAGGFVYYIYTLSDKKIELFGKEIDLSVVVYILILALVFYVFSGQ